jgi:hypothetical protein
VLHVPVILNMIRGLWWHEKYVRRCVTGNNLHIPETGICQYKNSVKLIISIWNMYIVCIVYNNIQKGLMTGKWFMFLNCIFFPFFHGGVRLCLWTATANGSIAHPSVGLYWREDQWTQRKPWPTAILSITNDTYCPGRKPRLAEWEASD